MAFCAKRWMISEITVRTLLHRICTDPHKKNKTDLTISDTDLKISDRIWKICETEW